MPPVRRERNSLSAEVKCSFKARPVPEFNEPQSLAPVKPKKLTVPVPFNLATDNLRKVEIEPESPSFGFKAKEMPKFTKPELCLTPKRTTVSVTPCLASEIRSF